MMRTKDQLLDELKARIPAVTPEQAIALQQQGAFLVDVRESDEIAAGCPAGALLMGRSFLELNIEEAVPDKESTIVVLCAVGQRSLFAADSLCRLGYRDVRNLEGGFNRWKNAGIPFEIPKILDALSRERYSRHLRIPEVGESGQLKLLNSRVAIVGAGGLGSPAAFYLAAAGVGAIGIIDHDVVDRSNLQRQILFNDRQVGEPKAVAARDTLLALNPTIDVISHEVHLESANVEEIFSGYDLVVDGSDNFPTRYLVNDACVKLRMPNIHGAVYRFEGQVTVFWPAFETRRGPCYRCMYPLPPPPEMAPSCAEAGVLGVLPGIIGQLQAIEAVKILLGIGDPLVGRMLYFDALRSSFMQLRMAHKPDCAYCGDSDHFPGYVDYAAFCTGSST